MTVSVPTLYHQKLNGNAKSATR